MDTERLAHLPDRKRRELQHAVRILFEEFEDAQKTKLSDKARRGRILKLVLFGSYARGNWVEDRGSGYLSDYDLLVVVNDARFAEQYEAWEKAEERLLQELSLGGRLATPVNVIVHTLQDVNDQLAQGRPFFVDIARDGIVLHELAGFPFAEPKPLTIEEQHTEAARHFEHWFPRAAHRFRLAREAIKWGYEKEAAFDLHQATERLYHYVLLVLTLYSPKLHRLTRLRSQAESVDARLIPVWPRDTKFARWCFALLNRAYVDARYSPHYEITEPLRVSRRLQLLRGWSHDEAKSPVFCD
ncbi:HEPN domain-containing protein [Methylobacterium terricola]|uniref:HEPN domain-containing protein n=2 Tax=Methylobacterium terricola TaxID=2583531 RepID=A0A5C4L660_9HYPH|nr:HEPN domain-containing protein [Methylobacterium terricola]